MSPCMPLTREMLISPVHIGVEHADLTYSVAREVADGRAFSINPEAMLLAWYDKRAGEFSPRVQ
jgi:hypothetical protein